MKKIKIITAAIGLCMAASLFAGCNNQTGESAQVSRIEGGQTKISVENGGSDNAVSGAGNVPGPKKSLVMIHTAVKRPNDKNPAADLVTYVEEKVVEENAEAPVEEQTAEE